jgi:DNA primase
VDLRDQILSVGRAHLTIRNERAHELSAICPFHRHPDGSPERNPSFYMSLDTGLYFCHACGSSGNLYTFLRDLGVDRQTIRGEYGQLLDQAGSNYRPPPDPTKPSKAVFEPLPEALLGLFAYCPVELVDAGFTEQTLKHFEVGYDRWYSRVVYPLRTVDGLLMGLSGRQQRAPKYKIYTDEYPTWELPARPGWDKSDVLWNAHATYPAMYLNPQPQPIVLVEGFKACMWVHQAGFPGVNALLGTHLSWAHRFILERVGAPVYLFFDNNDPGETGAVKTGVKLIQSLNVSVVPYPDRLKDDERAQPDSCTVDELRQSMASALNFIGWLAR